MYVTRTTQLIVGIFVLVGIAALAYLSLRLGNVELFSPKGYVIYANFDNISGLKNGDAVEIAGVQVGKVAGIQLVDGRARVAIWLRDGVKVDDDAVAAVRTRGLIGDKHLAISPGASDHYLANGDTLRQTESAFVLENAIGQFISNLGSSSTGSGGTKSK